jgi:hypothetical protein
MAPNGTKFQIILKPKSLASAVKYKITCPTICQSLLYQNTTFQALGLLESYLVPSIAIGLVSKSF